MLTLFPGLLFLTPFSATLLRIGAALTFAYVAYRMIDTREHIAHTHMPLIGNPRIWMVWLSALITLATATLLLVGFWTQAAALVGMIIALKHGIGARSYSAIVPLSASAYFLLFVICLSLLLTGAGAFAFDLPL